MTGPSNDYVGTTCVVTGANGFVGSHLARGLVAAGARTRALVRETSNLELLEGTDAELVYGDVCDRVSLEAAFDGADYVFHVAGIVKTLNEADYDRVNADGCEQVCEAAKTAAPQLKRLLNISSMAASGPTVPGKPLREGDPEQPVSVYGRSKLAGEQVVRRYADVLPTTTVRPTLVYGPGDSATFDLFKALSRHLKAVITGGPRIYSYVYVTDLVDGIMVAAAHVNGLNETFFVTSPEVLSYEQFQEEILEVLGTWALRIPVPAGVMPAVGRLAEWMARRRKKAGILSRQKVAEALPQAWICSPDKAQELLGFETRVRIPEGLRLQADWYREHGWL